MLEDIKNTTDEAKSYTTWFESEWKRNGVDELVKHNKQLEANVYKLLSVIEQAEKAFEEINYQFELHEYEVIDNAIKQVDNIATEALKAIRGE